MPWRAGQGRHSEPYAGQTRTRVRVWREEEDAPDGRGPLDSERKREEREAGQNSPTRATGPATRCWVARFELRGRWKKKERKPGRRRPRGEERRKRKKWALLQVWAEKRFSIFSFAKDSNKFNSNLNSKNSNSNRITSNKNNAKAA